MEKKCSETGNWTPVSRVTGGDTHHYTISDWDYDLRFSIVIWVLAKLICLSVITIASDDSFALDSKIPRGLVVRIWRSHRQGPGSIPGTGKSFLVHFPFMVFIVFEVSEAIVHFFALNFSLYIIVCNRELNPSTFRNFAFYLKTSLYFLYEWCYCQVVLYQSIDVTYFILMEKLLIQPGFYWFFNVIDISFFKFIFKSLHKAYFYKITRNESLLTRFNSNVNKKMKTEI